MSTFYKRSKGVSVRLKNRGIFDLIKNVSISLPPPKTFSSTPLYPKKDSIEAILGASPMGFEYLVKIKGREEPEWHTPSYLDQLYLNVKQKINDYYDEQERRACMEDVIVKEDLIEAILDNSPCGHLFMVKIRGKQKDDWYTKTELNERYLNVDQKIDDFMISKYEIQ